jgi:2-amino-4-hydroxy-6-hydroxymethyldihydropteridine diphosphokinase
MIDAFVALGSNLGDRLDLLGRAVELLSREPGFSVRAVSSVYDTAPVGPPQPRYLNAVVRLTAFTGAAATLKRLHAIEEALGRVRRERWGPRELDLDLLFFGDQVLDGPLEVPHPRLHERAFVLVPLCELCPDMRHPLLGRTAGALLDGLSTAERAGVRKLGPLRRRELPDEPDADVDAPASER